MGQDAAVSVRKFGRLVGKSHTWIRTLVKRGELACNELGQVYLSQRIKAEGKRSTTGDLTHIRQEIQKAKLDELTYRVELLKLELEERRAAVVPKAEVVEDVDRVRRILTEEIYRDLQAIAKTCENRPTREIEAYLGDWLNAVIKRTNERI